jgi:flagellar basal body-associated protein FliL
MRNRKAATCATAQGDFTDAILIAVLGTMLLIVGGFISVLVGQKEAQTRPQHAAQAPAAPPYGPPR